MVYASCGWPSGVGALFASRILTLILAATLTPAFAAPARDAAGGSPRLASLQIEILPEFDRPAALVILRGEIAPDVALPADVSLRIAATSGGPAAVAYSTGLNSSLLNLTYDRRDAGAFIALKFKAPERFFHVEFYDPLVTSIPGRSYTYVWTGDLAADRLRVILQEPAMASELSVQPPLDARALGQDGLRYRSSELGAFEAGRRLDVQIRYTKTDPRTSLEIVKPEGPPGSSPSPSAAPTKAELAIWLVSGVVVLGLGAWAMVMLRLGRKRVSAPQLGDAGFCRKCGAPRASDGRFCSKCGTPFA
jgi:hypothetical protein